MCAYVKPRSARVRSTWVFYHWIKLPILWPRQIWSISENYRKWLFQKYTLHNTFDDPTRVRRLTGILRCARVRIFIPAYVSFWFQLSGFSSNLTGHHETKTAKPIWSCRSKYSNFFFQPRLWSKRKSWIDSAPSEPSNPSQSSNTGTNVASFPRTNMSWKEGTGGFEFLVTLGGDIFTSGRLQDKNWGATDSGRPLLPPLLPISCVCRWSIQTPVSTNIVFVNIWGHIRVY
jgi:hypothetical protein